VKVYGFISVRANPPLTTLRIGDTAVPVRPRVMFCAGRTTVVGFRGSQEACRADLEIVAGTEVRFDC
jgi:hypothetical protein